MDHLPPPMTLWDLRDDLPRIALLREHLSELITLRNLHHGPDQQVIDQTTEELAMLLNIIDKEAITRIISDFAGIGDPRHPNSLSLCHPDESALREEYARRRTAYINHQIESSNDFPILRKLRAQQKVAAITTS